MYYGDLYITLDISTVEVSEEIAGRLVKIEKTRYTFRNLPMMLIDFYANHQFRIKPKILEMTSKYCELSTEITDFDQIDDSNSTETVINIVVSNDTNTTGSNKTSYNNITTEPSNSIMNMYFWPTEY